MQENFSRLNQTHLDELEKNGVLILPDFISTQTIDLIRKEVSPWLKNISFNTRISSIVIGNNQWIEHLGLCSLTALRLAVDDQFINFVEDYFDTTVSLGSFSLQRKIFPEKKLLRLHSDRGGGLAVFLYLTNPSEKRGLTQFAKGSHTTEIEDSFVLNNKVDDATYIDKEKSPFKSKHLIKTTGGIGTMVIFDRRTWHQLPKFKEPGRQIIMMNYFHKDSPSQDHLTRNSFLQSLSERQKEVYLSNSSSYSLPSLVELGDDKNAMGVYKIPTWKLFAYYLRYKWFSVVKNK